MRGLFVSHYLTQNKKGHPPSGLERLPMGGVLLQVCIPQTMRRRVCRHEAAYLIKDIVVEARGFVKGEAGAFAPASPKPLFVADAFAESGLGGGEAGDGDTVG